MKKSLVVLLIAVLALSAVFAADVAITVEGDVSASYEVDFDNGVEATYTAPAFDAELAWEVSLPVAKAGANYPYINVAGTIDVDLTDLANSLEPSVDFTAFEIVGEDWKVDFLAEIGSVDYAVSAIDTYEYDPIAYSSKYHKSVVTGRPVTSALTYRWLSGAEESSAVSFTKDGIGSITLLATTGSDSDVYGKVYGPYNYDQMIAKCDEIAAAGKSTKYEVVSLNEGSSYEFSEVFAGDCDSDDIFCVKRINYTDSVDKTYAVEAESVELKLADSVTTQFGFGFANKSVFITADNEATGFMKAGFSTKSSYEDILTVAADFGYDFSKAYISGYDKDAGYAILNEYTTTDSRFSVDVASSFKYEMVSVDVYYAHGLLSYYYAPWYDYKTASYADNLLSVKSAVEVEEIGTTFTFVGQNLLNINPYLSYEAVNTYFDNYVFTFDASANVGGGINNAAFGFLAEADYTEEVGVTAYAGVTAYQSLRDDNTFFPVFETGFAYAKNGFSFSVDFSSLRELNRTANIPLRIAYNNYLDSIDGLYLPLGKVGFTVKAGYEAEKFTVSSALEYNSHETVNSLKNFLIADGLYYTLGIESDKLVDGATLSLEYESAELLGLIDGADQFGTLTAAVTVEF